MEEKKNSLNAGQNNPSQKKSLKQPDKTELFRKLEIEQQESEKQFQVEPEYFTPQENPKKFWKPSAETKKKFFEEGREDEYFAQKKFFRINPNPASEIIEKEIDNYIAEEERLKPENRYKDRDCWIIEKDKDGRTKNFRSNGSTDVLVIEADGTEKFYKKTDGVSRADFFAYYAGIPIYKEDKDANRRSERVLRNAGFYSDGTKWYNTTDSRNDATKKFDIYGNSFYENLPPQNKFEKQIYDKNQNLYRKWGNRISAFVGNVAFLDYGTGKVLTNVPYHNQLVNRTKLMDGKDVISGKDMCQLTSLAMVLESKGFRSGDKKRRLPDVLYDIAENENLGGNLLWNKTNLVYDKLHEKSFSNLKTKLYETDKWNEKLNLQDIKNQIDKGNPVVMSIGYKTRKTVGIDEPLERYCGYEVIEENKERKTKIIEKKEGHIVAVVGYTDKGFIVHDPYGNLNKGENEGYINNRGAVDFDGSFVEYDYNKWSIGEKWFYAIE